jgi:conjugal transfer pilus assembly protein TraF
MALPLVPSLALAQALQETGAAKLKQGYWWYEPPPPPAKTEEPDALVKPEIPPMAQLATWTPPRIRKLIEQQRDYAATVLTVEAVADFWRLQDFARRKARAFAGVTQLAMLQHPELNSKSANPMVGDARAELNAQKDGIRRSYLRAKAGEFALIMFSRPTCGYLRIGPTADSTTQASIEGLITSVTRGKASDATTQTGRLTPSAISSRRGRTGRSPVGAPSAVAACRGNCAICRSSRQARLSAAQQSLNIANLGAAADAAIFFDQARQRGIAIDDVVRTRTVFLALAIGLGGVTRHHGERRHACHAILPEHQGIDDQLDVAHRA